jgi:ParB family transcriptional regulator, chromosome partitioning protein
MAKKPASHSSKPRLGRGLSSLIGGLSAQPDADERYESAAPPQPISATPPATDTPAAEPIATGKPLEIAVDEIAPNPYQPRREFDPEELAELSDSIATQGVLQPLIVVPAGDEEESYDYILIAGERRLRAARLADLMTVPCVVRQASRQEMFEWALIENIQRSDLNAVERAEAYRDYMNRFDITQVEAAERLGQARATVANYLRILDLHESVQKMLLGGELTFGHAKVLAGLAGDVTRQTALARRAVARGMSVRQLEGLIAAAQTARPEPAAAPRGAKPPYIVDLEEQLTHVIGTRVTIKPARAKNSGRLIIDYYNLEDFDRITASLGLNVES